jgi:LysM repeat protein
MNRGTWTEGWRLNVALTAGVMATVLMALIMAQLDALQAQPAAHARLVIANIQATAVSGGSFILLPPPAAPGNPAPTTGEAPLITGGPVAPDVNPRVDGDQAGAAPEFPVCGEVPAGWLLYTVAEGDSVTALAAATGSDPAAILAANCLTGDALSAGMQLLLPSEPAAVVCGPPQWWVRYQVRVGDTLAALARSRNTTVAEVLLANCRDSEALTAGQMIFLPPGGTPPIAPPPVVPPPVVPPPVIPTTASPVASPTPPPPTAGPPQPGPTTPPLPTVPPTAVVPTAPPVPTRVPPGATATPPVLPPTAPPPTSPPPTAVPPTAPPPTQPPPTLTPVPTRVPPTQPPPTLPPPTLPPPTVPPPTSTPVPPPTNTPEPPPTETPLPPPTNTPEPEPTSTPVPDPTQTWYRSIVWQWYWR